MYGVPIDGIGIDLFVVIEDTIAPKGPRADNVAVRQDVAFLGINDKARGLAGQGRVGVEGAGQAEADGYDVAHHPFDGGLPFGGVGTHGYQSLVWDFLDDVFLLVHHVIVALNVWSIVAGGLLPIDADAGAVVFRRSVAVDGFGG